MTPKRSERRRYTKEFKTETVELLLNSDKTAVVLSGELGIRTEVLYRWKREYLSQKENAFPGVILPFLREYKSRDYATCFFIPGGKPLLAL